MRAATITLTLALAACATPPKPAPRAALVARPATVEELVRIRCSLDGDEVVTAWTGSVYAFVPGEAPAHVLDVAGMNVARCLRADDGWHLTSRELLFYLDPADGTVLDRWANPWTGETVPVVHVANRVVQAGPFGEAPLQLAAGTATLILDVPLFYPNRLASDPALAAYAPSPSYQAGEFFALSAPAEQALDARRASVPAMTFGWHRVGPWLPWMKAGDRAGYLLYSAHGAKVGGLEDLPAWMQREIAERLPLYRHAPRCLVDERNVTSWSYFAEHLEEYLAGARFPAPAPERPEPCVAD